MVDTFYRTLELNNIRMDSFLFSFLGKYRHNAIVCDRIRPKSYEFPSQCHFKLLSANFKREPLLARQLSGNQLFVYAFSNAKFWNELIQTKPDFFYSNWPFYGGEGRSRDNRLIKIKNNAPSHVCIPVGRTGNNFLIHFLRCEITTIWCSPRYGTVGSSNEWQAYTTSNNGNIFPIRPLQTCLHWQVCHLRIQSLFIGNDSWFLEDWS